MMSSSDSEMPFSISTAVLSLIQATMVTANTCPVLDAQLPCHPHGRFLCRQPGRGRVHGHRHGRDWTGWRRDWAVTVPASLGHRHSYQDSEESDVGPQQLNRHSSAESAVVLVPNLPLDLS